MAARLLIIFLIFTSHNVYSQYFSKEKELVQKATRASSDEEKIKALGELAHFYYIFRADKKGDSVLQKQLLLAEMSNNKVLIFNTLFGDAIINIPTWSSRDAYDKALAFLDKGLSYSVETGNKEYEAIAYTRKAFLLRKRGDHNNALHQLILAITSAEHVSNDSLKSLIHIETGDVFLAKSDYISAYKNYNLAFDLAYSLNNVPLQSEIHHRLANLYQSLSDLDEAKKNLLKSLDLNTTAGNKKGLMKDYYNLARVSEQKDYVDKLLDLAAKENSTFYLFYARRLLFYFIMVSEKDSKKALAFLKGNEDLNQSYLNTGMANYYWNIGNIFKYANQPDSAIWYYNLGKAVLEKSVDASIAQSMNTDIGECYSELKQTGKAIECFEKAMSISEAAGDLDGTSSLSSRLGILYAEAGDFKKAYEINRKNLVYKDSLKELSAQKKILLLEVERENKKHEKDLADQASQALRIRNLQYMGISIAIASIFMFMVLLGMFPVSRLSIRLLSFMAFICLFEFIVLLVDSWLHKVVHGEPLKIWLAKIGLIAILVPIQHYMEHGLVRFLASQRLLRMRQHLSVKRLWIKLITYMKKPAPVKNEAGFEEDTAVL